MLILHVAYQFTHTVSHVFAQDASIFPHIWLRSIYKIVHIINMTV